MKNLTTIIEKISQYQPVLLQETPKKAAVMIILLKNPQDDIDIVITKRSSHLPTYAGHYSFPGGMFDDTDADLYATAVREVHEELSLLETSYQYVGQLDDFLDREGDLVRPYVAIMNKDIFEQLHKESLDEIDEIYYFSLQKLSQIKDDPALHAITRRRPSYAFKEDNVFIWGLTATILIQLSNIITGKHQSLGKTLS